MGLFQKVSRSYMTAIIHSVVGPIIFFLVRKQTIWQTWLARTDIGCDNLQIHTVSSSILKPLK